MMTKKEALEVLDTCVASARQVLETVTTESGREAATKLLEAYEVAIKAVKRSHRATKRAKKNALRRAKERKQD